MVGEGDSDGGGGGGTTRTVSRPYPLSLVPRLLLLHPTFTDLFNPNISSGKSQLGHSQSV